MPTDAINLEELLIKIQKGEIKMDKPLITYPGNGRDDFFVFQDSGLNVLMGHEGNGKTKFLTHIMLQLLEDMQNDDPRFKNWKLLNIDTERPESQYAKTVEYIITTTIMAASDVYSRLHFLSVMDLNCKEIISSINDHLSIHKEHNFVVIIDHVLPLVNDLNSTSEATEIDQFIKQMIAHGHIIIASIHKPYSGLPKGLGHVGSALQRLASFILEISTDIDGNGFEIKQVKSRISGKSNNVLTMKLDGCGNIDSTILPVISSRDSRKEKPDESLIVNEIFEEYQSKGLKDKKQLLALISKKKKYTPGSSSLHTYYNNYLKDKIPFTVK